jgi:hypothetical protein
MSREIKFRGLSAKSEFVYGDLRNDREGTTAYWAEYSQRICWSVDQADHNCPVKNGTIGQFTGLQAKGIDLYEGDVVKICDGSINGAPWFRDDIIVKFNKGRFNLPLWFMSGDIDSTHWVTIIGNIHENTELLK